jgi:hypothetical protein
MAQNTRGDEAADYLVAMAKNAMRPTLQTEALLVRKRVGQGLLRVRDKASTSEHIADYFSHLAECLLSGVKRTLFHVANMSANDPKRTPLPSI